MPRSGSSGPERSRRDAEPLSGRARSSSESGVRFATAKEAEAYLLSRPNLERTRPERVDPDAFKLDRTRALLAAMGNPQDGTRFVHVAGSKGKGSVCEMLAAALAGCGYATGLYTSPHLVDVRERIRINNVMIPVGEFGVHLSRTADAADAVEPAHGPASFFEILTAAAFSYFADQAVDIAVIEVGLGGRLDSTNVITPLACAITAIQLEHTQILGDTLAKIAREKAGILKKGVPAFTIPQSDPTVLSALREEADRAETTIIVVGEDIEFTHRFETHTELGHHARVCLNTERSSFEHIPVPLKGEHQAFNCALVLAVLDALQQQDIATPEIKVAAGLARTPTAGRLELVCRAPRIVVDGAHTPESVLALMQTVGPALRPDTMVVVFGCAADKSVAGMMAALARGADKVIFTKAAGSSRAMEPKDLQRQFPEIGGRTVQVAATVAEALALAERAVGRNDVICVTGSFYVAGEAKKLIEERLRRKVPDPKAVEPKAGLRQRPTPKPPI